VNLSLFCSFCSGMLSLQATLCLCNRNIKNTWDAEAVCCRIVYWGETVNLVTKRLRLFGGILSCHVNSLLHQLFIDIAHITSMQKCVAYLSAVCCVRRACLIFSALFLQLFCYIALLFKPETHYTGFGWRHPDVLKVQLLKYAKHIIFYYVWGYMFRPSQGHHQAFLRIKSIMLDTCWHSNYVYNWYKCIMSSR
jgi:hypothetical protein